MIALFCDNVKNALMMKYSLTIILFTLLLPTKIFCQEDNDSTKTGLEELLNKQVTQNEYVESASKYNQLFYESPYSLDVITNKDIEQYGYTTFSDIISSLGGMYLSNDLNYEYIGISGLGVPTDYNSRIQVLIDGHQLSDQVYNSNLLNELSFDVRNIDRIEVIKGPGSVLYGGNAMLGIINIIPKKGKNAPAATIKGGTGSYNLRQISGAFNYKNKNNLNLHLSLNYSQNNGRDFYFSNYDKRETNNGIVQNLDGEKKYGFYTSIKYKSLEITGMSSFRRKDVPNIPYSVDFGSNSPTTDVFSFAEIKSKNNISYDKTLTTRVFYDQYYFKGSYIYSGLSYWDTDDSKSAGAEVNFLWDILPNNRITAGIEYTKVFTANYLYRDVSSISSKFDFSFNKYASYIQDEFNINKYLTFYFALRYDDYGKTGDKLTPRVTFIISPDNYNTIRVLWGTSFRMPTLYEKYNEDYSSGYRMNPNLKPEDISTFEINWNNRILEHLTFNTGAFYNRINNFIDLTKSPDDSLSFFSNSERINIAGIKFEANLAFDENTNAYLRYAWQKGKNRNGSELVNSPDNLLKAGIFKEIYKTNASIEYVFETSRLTYKNSRTRAINYAALSISNSNIIYGFRLALRINNLFNKTIQYPGGQEHLETLFTMPGRNYIFSASYELF
jgi:iron complex outermembrane receptor protein